MSENSYTCSILNFVSFGSKHPELLQNLSRFSAIFPIMSKLFVVCTATVEKNIIVNHSTEIIQFKSSF